MIHEGGYSIQAVDADKQRQDKQFADQQHGDDIGMFNVESELRNNRESFDRVRNLSPTRYRFRTINALGQDIRHNSTGQSTAADTQSTPYLYPDDPDQSIRVECREPVSGVYTHEVNAGSRKTPDYPGRPDTCPSTAAETKLVIPRPQRKCLSPLGCIDKAYYPTATVKSTATIDLSA